MTGKGRRTVSIDNSRSKSAVRLTIPILGLVGMGICSYLAYVHYENIKPVCLPNAPCDPVLSSQYAQMWGIPISVFGLLMYTTITVFGFWLWRVKGRWQSQIALATYAIALSGVLFTLYLYYLEIFEIHAFCTWCIASSLVIISILVLSLINLSFVGLRFKEIPHSVRVSLSRHVQW